MPREDFIIRVYLWVCESWEKSKLGQLRSRGFAPKLSDQELVAMELIGEFLKMETDSDIWRYFRDHWASWFPNLGSRSNFVRQAANLYAAKQRLHEQLIYDSGALDSEIFMADGLPIPICALARAKRSKIFRGQAEIGYCPAKREYYYGFKGVLLINNEGMSIAMTAVAANKDERDAIHEVIPDQRPDDVVLIGDRGYISADLKEHLGQAGVDLQTPLRKNMHDPRDPRFVKQLISKRRLVETVISQLSDRFRIQKNWARDLWHFTNRITRKLLSHALAFYLNVLDGKTRPAQLAAVIS